MVDYILVPPPLLPRLHTLTVAPVPAHVSDHDVITVTWPDPTPAPQPEAPLPGRPSLSVPRTELGRQRLELALAVCLGSPSVTPALLVTKGTVDLACASFLQRVSLVFAGLTRRRCAPRPAANTAATWYNDHLGQLNSVTRRCAAKVRSLPASHPARPAAERALASARLAYKSARLVAERRWRTSAATSFVGLAARHPRQFWRSIFGSE